MGRVSTLRDFGLDGSPGVLYTEYDPAFLFLQERAAQIRGRFANLSTKILVAGCGIGVLVKHLSDLGYTDVWGCDLSTELIGYGKALYPDIASRLLVANCLSNSGNQLPSMTGVRRAAGLNGNARFALCITDDLLTVMANLTEVQTCLTVLRATAQTLVHVLWPRDDTTTQDPALLWYSVPQEWQAIIGGGEWVVNAIDGTVYGSNGEVVP